MPGAQHSISGIFRYSAKFFLAIWLGLVAFSCTAEDDLDFPKRPIKVIVPFSAGGGSDTFGRIIQSAFDKYDLLPQKLVMINVPGAGGTIGSRRAKNVRPDGYTILLLHEGILTAKFSGRAPYGPEAFEPIAGTGDAVQLIAVRDTSPLKDLTELVDQIRAKPDTVVFGANLGAPSHFAGLMIEQQAGEDAAFRFTQTGGGAKRIAGLQGEHMDVTSFSIAEYMQYRDVGLRALAVLAPKRHPDIPDVQTAREQGLDIVSVNTQFWWAPKGTAPERIQVIATALKQAMQTEQVLEKLSLLKIKPTVLVGQELQDDIRRRTESMSQVSSREVTGLPNIPLVLLGLCALTGIAFVMTNRSESDTPNKKRDFGLLPWLTICMLGYVILLQFTRLGFVTSTIVFLVASASLIWKSNPGAYANQKPKYVVPAVLVGALLFAFGIQYLFTQVLVVDLP